jgi:hypothetical protein
MPMWLARATVVPRIKESKQSVLLAMCPLILPSLQAGIRSLQIILLETVCLLFVAFRGDYEVFSYYWVFVEHEQVARTRGGYIGDVEIARWIVERI